MSKRKQPTLTTDSGTPVPSNRNSLTAGPRGPLLVQDHPLLAMQTQPETEGEQR